MVRVGTPGAVARPAWYDRNPSSLASGYYGTAIAPRALQTEATYTVPAGKKAIVEQIQLWVSRESAATTPNEIRALANFTPSGGSVKTILAARIRTNAVGDKDSAVLAGAITLFPGDKLELLDGDSSTGGTYNAVLGWKITEFEA